MIAESLRRLLEEQVPYARLLRRQLHAVPELGGDEYETADLVKVALPVAVESIAGTGLVVRLGSEVGGGKVEGDVGGNVGGNVEGNAVGVRAELDGLPLVERTGAPFSATGDRMHACGHDVHLAALVALVRAAAEVQSELPAPLIAIFQPSEERSPSGALQVTADAGLVGESKAFVAVHVHPELPWGSLGLEPGVVNAQADEVQIRIEGVGGHAAYPHRARSVVPALLALGQGMREIAGRLIDPMRPALVEIGVLRAGEAANVIPGIGELHATVRTLAHGDQSRLLAGIRHLADRISAAYDCAATVVVTKSDPALINDAGLVDAARHLTSDLAFDVAPPWRSCGGDDFAHYGQHGPALMAFVGLDGAPGFTPAALHTAHFLPPEEAVDQCARALLLAYLAAASLPSRGRAPVTNPV